MSLDPVERCIAQKKAALAAAEYFERKMRTLQHPTKRNQQALVKAQIRWRTLQGLADAN